MPPSTSAPPKELRPGGELDRFIAARAEQDEFSGTVLLTWRGRTVLERSYGLADKARDIPNRAETRFDVASITKSFTAVALAQLVEKGEVALHETLGTYLDGFPPGLAGTVTVHHLLTHTAGVDRTTAAPPSGDTIEETWQANLEAVRATKAPFPPGSRFQYSNGGYFTLGAIVAAVAGDFYDYVRTNIIERAKLRHTSFPTRDEVRASREFAHRYATDRQTGERYDLTMSENMGLIGMPDHGLYSTVGDLLRFHAATLNGTLLERSFAELFTGSKTALGPDVKPTLDRRAMAYCYGFFRTVLNGREVLWHSGSGPGMANMLDSHPGTGWSMAILGNYDDSVDPIVNRARQLITRA